MTVLNVLKTASLYLDNADKFSAYYDNNADNVTEDTIVEFNKLVAAFNNVVGKLSCSYFDCLSASVIMLNSDGEYDLRTLTHKCRKVINITKDGCPVKYMVMGPSLSAKSSGAVTITYAYIPEAFDYTDDFDLFPMIDLSTLAMGVASEYSYINAVYDDAQMWQERFEKSLKEIKARMISNKFTKAKRWI